ncbi:MAG: phosphoribosylamine--glycine ligase, partial [Planctomycetes bacterium]|nr:phosphoribosylamine--glycine ligase [Planctomycetota bacterium]
DIDHVLAIARRESIDLTIVGPEDPLAAGLVDAFEQNGLRVFGPNAAAARLETDKAYAKQVMRQHAVPTAEARFFEEFDAARAYIASRDQALVVKAAGLAKGKGVFVCDDPAAAILAAERLMIERAFGDAGAKILVEERLAGPEASVLAIVNGRTLFVLETAQDHKRLEDGDRGPNTGGMGAFSPTPTIDAETMGIIETQILIPVLDALVRDGIHYRGVLYAGLMLTAAGPKVLEFNCRFGDPEAQVLLMRLQSDLLDLLEAAVDGRLEQADVRWDPRPALCVVMASGGYPGSYKSGLPITGLPDDAGRDDLTVFHAGTARRDGQLVTAGGRVLGVTALGDTLADARRRAYDAVERIGFEGACYRRDLGQ